MEQTTSKQPEAADDDMRLERNAGLVMATNNSSIVSKRSVERLYLPEPHFFRYFVKKPIRRSPTINRGYWLRMRAVDWVVRQFLEKPTEKKKVVLNLGCGYDPIPFQWLAREPELCRNAKFVDIDYEPLMQTKREIIWRTPQMKDLLQIDIEELQKKDPAVLLDSPEYAALGCDLRNLPRLKRLLKSVVDIEECLVLCVAEVSITYMHTAAANALISWTTTLSSDVTFCLLEQCSPDRLDHPFTLTMMKHFAKLGTPLHSILEYPGEHAQSQRFLNAGFTHIEYQSLWDLWANSRFLSPSQRISLDHVEPFDEWEDFALFASHYCLVVAHNRSVPTLVERPRSRRDSCASIRSDISARTVSPFRSGSQWFAYRYCKEPGDLCQRHHGSAYPIPGQDAIGIYGGTGPKGRLATSSVCRPRWLSEDPPVVLPSEAGARCCHTITALENGDNLMVGGRGNPAQAMSDCWIQKGQRWYKIHDLPEPRYRHRAVPVVLPNNTYGAVVFGGKTGPSQVAVDTLLWEPEKGWRVLRSLKSDPVPRFGPNLIKLGFNHGLLFGGMRQDGIICQGLWRWRLITRGEDVAGISFYPSNALDASVGAYPWFARLGASYGILRDELLIIGGIAKHGCIPKVYEILSILGSFSAFNEDDREMDLRMSCVEPATPPDCPRPFLIGHSSHRTRTGMSILLGGGATCFSFGNYFNTGVWILYERESAYSTDWTVVNTRPSPPDIPMPEKKHAQSHGTQETQTLLKGISSLTEEIFLQLVRASRPQVMSGLDFGPCRTAWTETYFRDKISPDRRVVVHMALAKTMNFQRKDFAYETLTFGTFLDRLGDQSSHLYLRSLASSSPSTVPAKLDEDWPEIASDFHVPQQMQVLASNLHSSPFRMSNEITMWLHYDVMANVLFQIQGVKKLILFPPTDRKHLSFPPGSTTSELDVFRTAHGGAEAVRQGGDIILPRNTSPQIALLRPGDALFIPPLWSHAGVSIKSDGNETTSETWSRFPNPFTNIAVNTFFHNLPLSTYASGRDIYGNRDLAAYEDGRRDVEKIVRRFTDKTKGKLKKPSAAVQNTTKDSEYRSEDAVDNAVAQMQPVLDEIPRDVARAYLEALADELMSKAATLQ